MLAAHHTDAMAASNESKLSSARADALLYYNGDLSRDMPVAAGRSSAVSMDVSDTIEGILPQLMEVLCGTDDVVKFDAVGPEDVQAAEQETDYINHVLMNRNNGFLVMYSFIKDALLSKVGVVKIWWEEEEREERETYYDKTVDEYALIVSNPDVEVVEHSEHSSDDTSGAQSPPVGLAMGEVGGAGEIPGSQPGYSGGNGYQAGANASPMVGGGLPGLGGQTLHDITVVTRKKYARARVMGVPPEEFGIERGARNVRDSNYCFHRIVDRTESDLIEQGYDPKQIKALGTYRGWSYPEEIDRDTVDEHSGAGSQEINTAARPVEIIEHYVRMDYTGDGQACLYKVVTGGGQGEILRKDGKPDIEKFDAMPFAAMTPIIVTHRFYGKSLADMVMDIMRIKTALLRALLDNAYLANNRQKEVSEAHASENTLDDLLVSRPGGIVRVKQPGGIRELEHTDIGAHVYPLLEYQDQRLETRTGFTKRGQGIDADALSNQSATAAKIVENASQARVLMIARIFAETGIRDMALLLHSLIKKHGQEAAVVRLRNQWVSVDPRNWKTRDDLTVHVGLGRGSKTEELAITNMLIAAQEKGVAAGIVSRKNLYNTAKRLTKIVGERDPEAFFVDPAKPPDQQPGSEPIPPPVDPKLQAIQMQAQLGEKEMQSKAQIETLQAQADIATQDRKTTAEIAQNERKSQREERLALIEHDLKMREMQQKMVNDDQKHRHSMAVSAEKQKEPGSATVEVKHGAEQLTGPLSEVVFQLGEHLSKQQQSNHAALTAAIEANKPKPSKGKRIKGPSGKIYQIEDVN